MTSPSNSATETIEMRSLKTLIFSSEIGTVSVVMMCLMGKSASLCAAPAKGWDAQKQDIYRVRLLV